MISYVNDTSGLFPKLEPLIPTSEVQVDIGENKVDSLKVMKTKALLFPAENKGPLEGGSEPLHTNGLTLIAIACMTKD